MKKNPLLSGCFALATSLLLALQPSASAQTFSYQPIQITGSETTLVYFLNNQNFYCGYYNTPSGSSSGFLVANGQLININPPGSVLTQCLGVNAAQKVSGTYYDGSFVSHAFLYQGGVYTDLVPAPSVGTVTSASAFEINDANTVVGFYNDAAGRHGFSYTNGIYTTYPTPAGFSDPLLFGVNNNRVITAQATNLSSTIDSFYLNGSMLKKSNVPGAINSFIHGLNLGASAVYAYTDAAGFFHGSLNNRGRGQFIPINYPGAPETFPNSINDFNTIVGTAQYDPTTVISFIARPAGSAPLKLPAGFNETVQKTNSRVAIDARGMLVPEKLAAVLK